MGESIIASIMLFAGSFPPRCYDYCEGQTMNISDNTALFSLLGTTYGGNGSTTFCLPDLREAEKNLGGVRYIITVYGIYPTRE